MNKLARITPPTWFNLVVGVMLSALAILGHNVVLGIVAGALLGSGIVMSVIDVEENG